MASISDMAVSAPQAALDAVKAELEANGPYPMADHKPKNEWHRDFEGGTYVDMRSERMEELSWVLKAYMGLSWKQVMFALTQDHSDPHTGPQTPDATTFAARRYAKRTEQGDGWLAKTGGRAKMLAATPAEATPEATEPEAPAGSRPAKKAAARKAEAAA